MSDWKLILPEETINRALNPVAGATGNFAAVGGTVTRVTTYAKWGAYSYRVQTAANNQGMTLTLDALANAIHYVTLLVRGTLPAAWDWSVDNTNWTVPTLVLQIDDDWALYGAQFPAAQCNGSTTLRIYQNGAGSGDFYVDGVQVEERTYWTTLAMGDLEGNEWLSNAHASASQRSGMSRAGGRMLDLDTDYAFRISRDVGTGTMPVLLNIDDYTLAPGGELDSIKRAVRQFTLMGPLVPADGDLNAARQALELALMHDSYPQTEDGWQPVRLWYTGAEVVKEIAAHYQGGLEVAEGIDEASAGFEKLALRFKADDPFWYELGESSQVLDTSDSVASGYLKARLDEQWTNIGSFNGPIYALAEDEQYVYIGGDFPTQAADANQSYITRYDKEAGTFAAMGTGLNARVWAIAIGPDGTVYIGGEFTAAGGDTQADYFCTWDGSTFNNLGDPDSGGASISAVYALTIGQNGDVFVGGLFTAWAGTGANNLVYWDESGGAWTALASNPSAFVRALITAPDGTIYVGGNFTNYGGADGDYVSSIVGTTVTPLAAGLNGAVNAFAVTETGLLYIGGQFTNVGDANGDYIISWNGVSYSSLGTPPTGTVWALEWGYDGILYVVGQFSSAGGLTQANRLALWTGSSWAHWDIDLSSATGPRVVLRSRPDPVIKQNYDMWIGDTTGSSALAAGLTSVVNDGTAHAFPRFVVSRSGGTTAVIFSLKNAMIGRMLFFDYSLLDGEELTVDMDPVALSILSSLFGARLDATLSGDDFGDWSLQAGANDVMCLVDESGVPTLLAYLAWRDAYVGKN